MAGAFDVIIKGGTVVNHDGIGLRDIGIRAGRIAALGTIQADKAGETIEAEGLTILPGVIDTQVHFREPGHEHKEDLATGSLAAVMGGVTAVFEMPNTSPLTVSAAAVEDKLARARGRMHCDHAFWLGGTRDNARHVAELERLPGVPGIKVFVGSSTGDLLVEHEADLREILARTTRRVAFHAEDEARLRQRAGLRREGDAASHPEWRDELAALKATELLVRLAAELQKPIHVLHVTTAEEMSLLGRNKDWASAEVTPHHLTLVAPEAYAELGTRVQMNPPVRNERHRQALWWALAEGIADILGSDHAPHTLEEKAKAYPASPSGMPGVQTLVPVMLDHVNAGRLSLARLVDMTSHGPQRLFGIRGKGRLAVGYDADLTIVDLKAERVITNEWIASRCGWTPYHGRKVRGWPVGTIVRGRRVMWEGEVPGSAMGEPVRFV